MWYDGPSITQQLGPHLSIFISHSFGSLADSCLFSVLNGPSMAHTKPFNQPQHHYLSSVFSPPSQVKFSPCIIQAHFYTYTVMANGQERMANCL